VTDEPPPTKPAPPPEPRRDDENERPTVNPPFDVEAFARAATSPGPGRPPSDAPIHPPKLPSRRDEFVPTELRSERITITNEAELEKARTKSAQTSEPPRRTLSALSIADARAPTTPPPQGSLSPSSIESAVLGAIGSSPGPEITERTIEDPDAEMRERFSLGDYSGALEMSELILAQDPADAEAAECGENCRTVLENMYIARLGPLDRVPKVIVPRAQMRWLAIDHRAGFILSLIDGSSSVEMILDVCGMPRLDALRILHELVQQRTVAFQ
jgi:hypothetical protein